MAAPNTIAVELSNDAAGSFGTQTGSGFQIFIPCAATNATLNNCAGMVLPFGGQVDNVVLGAVQGVGTTGTCSYTANAKINGVAIAATAPVLNQNAGTAATSTYAAGTGITQVVLGTSGQTQFSAGAVFSCDFTYAGTTGPTTAFAGVFAVVTGKRFTE